LTLLQEDTVLNPQIALPCWTVMLGCCIRKVNDCRSVMTVTTKHPAILV